MFDGHHIFNTKGQWTSSAEAASLRNQPSLIPKIDREVHNELHANCPAVPLLGYHALMRVNKEFYPQRNTLDSIDDLLLAINSAAKHEKAHHIERSLAQLAAHAIELQIPFIREGLIRPERHLRIVQ